jgi:hypothetical protein
MLVSSFVGLGKVAVSTCSLTKEVSGGPTPCLHVIVADGREACVLAITVLRRASSPGFSRSSGRIWT